MIFLIFSGFVSSLSFSTSFTKGTGIFAVPINQEPFYSSPYFYRISIYKKLKENFLFNAGILYRNTKTRFPSFFLGMHKNIRNGLSGEFEFVFPSTFFIDDFMSSYFLYSLGALSLKGNKKFWNRIYLGIKAGVAYGIYIREDRIVEEKRSINKFESLLSIDGGFKIIEIFKKNLILSTKINIISPLLFSFGVCVQ